MTGIWRARSPVPKTSVEGSDVMQIKDIAGQKHPITPKQLIIVILVLIVLLAAVITVGKLIASHSKGILSGIIPETGSPAAIQPGPAP